MSNIFKDKESIIYTIKYIQNDEKYNINLLGKTYEKYKSIFNKIEKDKDINKLLKSDINKLESLFGTNYVKILDLNNKNIDKYVFYYDFSIKKDDTIDIIKKKIIVILHENGINVDENSLFLWLNKEDRINSLLFDYYDNLKNPKLIYDPISELKNYNFNKILNINFYLQNIFINLKYYDQSEYILLDYYNENNYIYCIDINSIFQYIYKNHINKIINNSNLLINISEFYFNKYFPKVSSQKFYKLLKEKDYYKINLKLYDYKKIKNNILKNEKENDLLDSINNDKLDTIKDFEYLILQALLQVNENNENLSSYINFDKLFKLLNPKNNEILKYVFYFNKDLNTHYDNVLKINNYYLYNDLINVKGKEKIKKDLIEDILKEQKKTKIKIKLLDNDTNNNTTIVLHNNGYYNMTLIWNEDNYTNMKKLENNIIFVNKYINNINKLNIFNYKSQSIIPPYISLSKPNKYENNNAHIINMHYNIIFKTDSKINLYILENILEHFDQYISIVNDEDLNEKFKIIDNYKIILSVLENKNLLSINKLLSLSSNEWNSIKFSNNKNEDIHMKERIKKIINTSNQKIIFIYKKFSDYKNKKRISDFITKYFKKYYKNLGDLVSDIYGVYEILSEDYNEDEIKTKVPIIDNIMKIMNMNFVDSVKSIYNWCNEQRKEKRSSIGIKCAIELKRKVDSKYLYKVDISGIKHFTNSFFYGNISELFKHIYLFLKKALYIYNNYNSYKNNDLFNKKIMNENTNNNSNNSIISNNDNILLGNNDDNILLGNDDEILLGNNDNTGNVINDNLQFNDLLSLNNNISSNNNTSNNKNTSNNNTSNNNTSNNNTSNNNKNTSNNNTSISNNANNFSRLSRLLKYEPNLFSKKSNQKNSYARACPRSRQPIILSESDFNKINKSLLKYNDKNKEGFYYRGYYYLCPDIFCASSNTVVNEKDLTKKVYKETTVGNLKIKRLMSGKCPDGKDAILPDEGLIVNNQKYASKELNSYPGFLDKNFHPDKICVPCCMKTDQSLIGKSKYNLYNSCMFDKKYDEEINKQSYKYIYKELKLLDNGRYGQLDEYLDSYLNNSQICNTGNLLKDNQKCFFRIGSNKNNSLISAITNIYNVNSKKHKYNNYDELIDNLVNHIKNNNYLLQSLNKGDLEYYIRNIFYKKSKTGIQTSYNPKEILNIYINILKNNDNLNENIILDYISRPLPFLFENGINVVIFEYNVNEKRTIMKCYKNSINNNSNEFIFLYKLNDNYESIIYEETKNRKSVFSLNEINTQIKKEISKCNIKKDSDYNIFNIYNVLNESIKKNKLDKNFKAIGQIYDDYNRVFGILLENNLIIPINNAEIYYNTDLKIIHISDIKKYIKLDYINVEKLYKKYLLIIKNSNLNISNININKLNYDISRKEYFSYLLENDRKIYFKNTKTISSNVLKKYSINETDNIINIYENIYNEKINEEINHVFYTNEIFNRLKYEFQMFINEEYNKNINKNTYYILNILLILNKDISIQEKRDHLYTLFFIGTKELPPLNNILLSSGNKKIDYANININERIYCKSLKNIDKCNENPYCNFTDNSCKYYIDNDDKEKYIYLLIEELLLLKFKLQELIDNYLNNYITLNEKYNEEYLVLNKTGLEAFLKKHNLLKEKNIFNKILNPNLQFDILSNISFKNIDNMTNINSYNLVREHLYPHINSGNMLLYNEKINKILQNELDNNYVNIRINKGGLYETLLYILSKKARSNNLLNPLIIKTQVLNYIKEQSKLWKELSMIYSKYDANFKNIDKFNKFSEVFLDTNHTGYNEELILINKIFELNIILLNHNASSTKNLFLCLGAKEKQSINDDNRYIMIDYEAPNKYSIIMYNNRSKNINKTIFTKEELPSIFFKNFKKCNT